MCLLLLLTTSNPFDYNSKDNQGNIHSPHALRSRDGYLLSVEQSYVPGGVSIVQVNVLNSVLISGSVQQ